MTYYLKDAQFSPNIIYHQIIIKSIEKLKIKLINSKENEDASFASSSKIDIQMKILVAPSLSTSSA